MDYPNFGSKNFNFCAHPHYKHYTSFTLSFAFASAPSVIKHVILLHACAQSACAYSSANEGYEGEERLERFFRVIDLNVI